MTYKEILAAAMRQSAIDCSCGEEDFRGVTHVFVENKASEQASKFLKSPNTCRLVSYGSNVVASCRKDLIPEITAFVAASLFAVSASFPVSASVPSPV